MLFFVLSTPIERFIVYCKRDFQSIGPLGPCVRLFVCLSVCLTEQDFLVFVLLTPFDGLFAPPSRILMFKFFFNFFFNPLGKVMERSGLRFKNFCS